TTFNIFDVVVVLVLVLSGLLAFFRGFVREILSLGAWVGAGLITLYYFPQVAEWIGPQLQNAEAEADAKSQLGIMVVAFVGTYLTALITIFIINRFLLKILKTNKDIGLFDNGLGLIFGVFRAGLLLSLGYFVLSFVFPEDNLPSWLADSETRPYVAKGAAILAKAAPEYLGQMPQFDLQVSEEGEGGLEGNLINQMLRSGTPPEEGETAGETPNYEYIRTDEFQRLLQQLGQQQQEGEKP
ncbi:MAG: hypothetical protein CMM93_00730, partial [Rickettsiales bacterium]|nr:hypothetical protein [Rickettsiales bacterium]